MCNVVITGDPSLTLGLPRGASGLEPSLLFVLFVHSDRFQIFGFDDRSAVEAFQIIDAITPGDDYSAVVLANGRYRLRGLHKADYGFILTMSLDLSSPKITEFCLIQPFPGAGRGLSLVEGLARLFDSLQNHTPCLAICAHRCS